MVPSFCLRPNLQQKTSEMVPCENGTIVLVQRLLQHSSAATMQRYIGIEPQKLDQAIENHAHLM